MRIDLRLKRRQFCIFLCKFLLIYYMDQFVDFPHHIIKCPDQLSHLILFLCFDLNFKVSGLHFPHPVCQHPYRSGKRIGKDRYPYHCRQHGTDHNKQDLSLQKSRLWKKIFFRNDGIGLPSGQSIILPACKICFPVPFELISSRSRVSHFFYFIHPFISHIPVGTDDLIFLIHKKCILILKHTLIIEHQSTKLSRVQFDHKIILRFFRIFRVE